MRLTMLVSPMKIPSISRPLLVALLAVTVLLAGTKPAIGQAFCALRDPHSSIAALYPTATSHRSIVRSLGEEERQLMREKYGHELRETELGRHTVYAVFRDETPLGFVHVRSEKARFGMIEIAWAIDLDLRVTGLNLQRGHDLAARDLLDGPFPARMLGLDFGDLEIERGRGVDSEWMVEIPEDQLWFAELLLEAAPRTLVATVVGWGPELVALRKLREDGP